MDEVIWIEVLSRHRSVLARHRCTGRGIRIGRAYTNDVVVDDPYVAPEHAHIVHDEEGRLLVEDLGTANRLHAGHGRKRLDRLALGDDSVFRIGQTYLRVRLAGHPVAPERQIGTRAHDLALIGGLFGAAFGGEALSVWLRDFSEFRADTYLVPLLGGTVLIGIWTALWSLLSRVFSGHARFEHNLVIALSGALGIEIASALNTVAAFGFSWSMLGSYSMVELLCAAAIVCFFHLRLIVPGRLLLAGGAVAALLVAAATIQVTMQQEFRPIVSQLYIRNLLPPSLRLAPVKDEASFFAQVGALRDKIDQDRAEAP